MMYPSDCISLQEAAQTADPASIFDAVSAYKLHMLTSGYEQTVLNLPPDVLNPGREILFCPDKSAAKGVLVFERKNPYPSAFGIRSVCYGDGFFIFFKRKEFKAWVSKTGASKGGRPPIFDWDAYSEAFEKRVREIGLPDPQNEAGWQNQSDVANWIIDLASREPGRKAPGVSIAKSHAKAFIEKVKRQANN